MKLNREQLSQQNFKVFVQEPNDTKPHRVMLPEFVDTDAGIVEMWVVPIESKDELLKKETLNTVNMLQQPKEIEDFAYLKKVEGKVFVLDKDNNEVC